MYLNTQSGLTPTLDAIGQIVQARQQDDAQMQGLASAGVAGLKPSDAPQGNFLTRLLGLAPSVPAPTAPPREAPQPAAVGQPAPSLPVATAAAPAQTTGAASPLAGFQGLIDRANATYGLPAGYLPRVASIESKFDPNAVSPTGAKGLFGFTKGTAADYGLVDPTNVPDSVDKVGQLTRDNAKALTQALGRPPTPGELYLAHQQGAAGAAALLKNPTAPAGQVLASIGADPKNITVNGGDPAMPAGAFAAKWTAQFGPGAASPAVPAGAPSSAPISGGPDTPAMSMDQIKALVMNPATRALGLQMWQQTVAPKKVDFAKPGETAFVNGRPTYQVPAAPMNVAPGSTVVDPSTGRPVYASPPNLDLKQTGADAFGTPVYGTFNPRTGATAPVPPSSGAPGVTTPGAITGGLPPGLDATKHGEDFLSTVDPTLAARVRGIIEGRAPYPTSYELTKPAGRFMAALVNQVDPTFDASNAASRSHTRQDFTSGATSKTITAGNTAIMHLGELSDAAERLKNSSIPAINALGQMVGSASGGNTAGVEFNTALRNYVDEATKFYRGSGGTETEIQERLKGLSPSMSPDQLRTAIQTEVALMRGKINALQDQWSNGMGQRGGQFPIIRPATQSALDRIAQRRPSDWVAGPAQPGPAPTNPAQPPQPGPQAAPPRPPQPAQQPPVPNARQAPDGHWYVPDPARPGKYMQVQ